MAINARQSEFVNRLLYRVPGGLRFTVDTPVLPNVWLEFASAPREQQELILTIKNEYEAAEIAAIMREMLAHLRENCEPLDRQRNLVRKPARVASINGQIAVRLYFDELMRVVLPLTPWWHETYRALRQLEAMFSERSPVPVTTSWLRFPQPTREGERDLPGPTREEDFRDALIVYRTRINGEDKALEPYLEAYKGEARPLREEYLKLLPSGLVWLIRISAIIADAFDNKAHARLLEAPDSCSARLVKEFNALEPEGIETLTEREGRVGEKMPDEPEIAALREDMAAAFANIYMDWSPEDKYPHQEMIWQVSKNRPIELAVHDSVLTVKADAADKLFNVNCSNLTWAVLDSGIDASHPAFALTNSDHEGDVRSRLREDWVRQGRPANINPNELPISALGSRVVRTVDFTRLRELLDYGVGINASTDAETDEFRRVVRRMQTNLMAQRLLDLRTTSGNPAAELDASDLSAIAAEAKARVKGIRARIREGSAVEWQDLEPALIMPNPPPPANDHGTHVAGILGADWVEDYQHERTLPLHSRTRRMRGMCPDINLIDVRVFRDDGLTDEFELLAAIQYLRWLNMRAGSMQVHGANISLSLVHEVRRFACGRTPVCTECNEAVAQGMVVVAAAGNRGYEMSQYGRISASDSYKTVSITDPGNANSVITVGSTHRKRPHEYGVSYFSSRGPTGDGRLKPDVVAPGEKIEGPVPGGISKPKDGTSMAAPHVSGVAAMLMARHTELIAKPDRIKQILCDTSTCLGRENYFQGAGLVDALRALQSA